MSESSPKKRPKAPVRIDVSRAVKMLADARELGVTAAAKRHRVTTRTIRRYRVLLRTDVELQTQYAALIELQDKTWVSERAKSLRCAAERAQVLLAKEDDLDKITRYIEKVGRRGRRGGRAEQQCRRFWRCWARLGASEP